MKSEKIKNPDKISSYFSSEAVTLLFVGFSGIICNIGLLAGPWFEGKLAQCLFDITDGKKSFRDMLYLALFYVTTIAVIQAMRYIKRFYVRRFGNNVNRSMKKTLYASLVNKSKAQIDKESIGSMMTKTVTDIDACAEGMRKFTTEVFDTGVVLISYIVMLFVYDWRLALMASIFPPFAYIIAEKMKKTVHKFSIAYKESAGRLNGSTFDRVENAVMYRVFGCDSEREEEYEKQLSDYEKNAVKANIVVASVQPLYQLVSLISMIFIVYFGSKNVLGSGWTSWDIAAFTTFLLCFSKTALKSSRAAKLFNSVQQAQISWKRIKPMMKRVQQYEETVMSKPSVLSVENLSFSYYDSKKVFSGLTFNAKPGEIIGVTGPVASGKSTLGKAFLCEYPYEGSIKFGENELCRLLPKELGGIVAYMGHEPELISDTVENNVLLGKSDDALRYIKEVCFDEDVDKMPDGIKTLVGNGGIRLSGGQQARCALARTLCHEKPVMVLDDPFSAVDKNTECKIFKNIMTGYTGITILISHRLHLFPKLDKIIWLENGKAVVGTHDEIMKSEPEYRKLYMTQTGGEADER